MLGLQEEKERNLQPRGRDAEGIEHGFVSSYSSIAQYPTPPPLITSTFSYHHHHKTSNTRELWGCGQVQVPELSSVASFPERGSKIANGRFPFPAGQGPQGRPGQLPSLTPSFLAASLS